MTRKMDSVDHASPKMFDVTRDVTDVQIDKVTHSHVTVMMKHPQWNAVPVLQEAAKAWSEQADGVREEAEIIAGGHRDLSRYPSPRRGPVSSVPSAHASKVLDHPRNGEPRPSPPPARRPVRPRKLRVILNCLVYLAVQELLDPIARCRLP